MTAHKDGVAGNSHPLNVLPDGATAPPVERIPLYEVYMRMAEELAKRSTCTRLQVGTVITDQRLENVLAIGYNGNARGLPALREADPNVVTAICSYDLSAGPMRVVARTGTLTLGLTLHRQGGGVLYAITDRAAIRGTLEFLVMTEAQRDERIAADEEGETSRELRVVSDTEQGLIVARVLLRLPSDRADAEALATGVACGAANQG